MGILLANLWPRESSQLSALLLLVSNSCVPAEAGGPPSTQMPKPEMCLPGSAPSSRDTHASVMEF